MNMSWWKKELRFQFFPSLTHQNSAAVNDSILLQIVLILLAGMILDGGAMLKVALLAAMGWWLGFLLILLRRPKTEKRTDQVFLRYGFLALLPLSLLTLPLWGLIRFW
jgi:hypothetical protein